MDEHEEKEEAANKRRNSSTPAQPVVTDNEATNCSETMSTNEEDYGEVADHDHRQKVTTTKNSRNLRHSNQSSVKNRLATPRRLQSNGQQQTCDDFLQSDSCYSAEQVLAQDETTTEATTLSLASELQAPPSYCTATRGNTPVCATLDAAHLNNVSNSLINQQRPQIEMSRTNGNFPTNLDIYGRILVASADPIERAVFSKTIGSSRTIDTRLETYLNEQSQPFLLTSTNNGQFQQQNEIQPANYMSNSASMPRIHFAAHSNNPAQNTSDLRHQHQIKLRPDNNQGFKLNWQQQQQLQAQHQMVASPMYGAPINHVISVGGSIHWKPHTNQYYATTTSTVPALAGPQPSPANEAQAGQSSRAQEATSIMDARVIPSMGQSVANGTMLANRNELASNGANFPRSISSESGPPLELNLGPHSNNSPQRQQHHNQRQVYATMMTPLRRSDENLERSSRGQQQAHRKRRRHRSTSGRSLSPQSSELRRQTLEAGANHYHQQIMSANHYGTRSSPIASSKPIVAPTLKTPVLANKHKAKAGHSKQTISAHCWLVDSSDDQTYVPSGRTKEQSEYHENKSDQHLTVAMMKQSQQQRVKQTAQSTSNILHLQQSLQMRSNCLTPETQVHRQDLITNLKTNSLKMEKILNRKSTTSVHSKKASGSNGDFEQVGSITKVKRSNSSSSASSDLSSVRHNHASTVVRLSALLSMLSNIVKRGPKSLKIGSNSTSSFVQDSCPAPANSISDSISAPSSIQTPYTTGSFAISSSSSTSAYATGSSHLSNSSNQSRLLHLNAISSRPIIMTQFKSAIPPSSASTAGSSMFYSSTSGASGINQVPSTHGYDYCDNRRINETEFNQNILHEVDLGDKVDDCSNPTSLEGSETSSSGKNPRDELASASKLKQEPRLLHMLMSDNELISAGSDQNNEAGFAQITSNVLPAVVSSATNTTARRRWWWISIKNWLRRPCKTTSDSEYGSDPSKDNQIEAARYKTLRSRRSTNSHGRGSSTLENIISLAKADKIFRIRLIASIIVSCILLGLICILVSLMYSHSSPFYQKNKLSLLIDDSDYDLSWLWSQSNYIRGKNEALKIPDLHVKNPTDHMDGALKSHLLMIERSERLNQFQQTIAHLTNIQLANDDFIDITQLARHLVLPSDNSQSQSSVNQTQNLTFNDTQHQRNSGSQITEADHDLVSLVLLSNLHWPMVKWRHQNQQPVANFLSFAIPPVSLGGTQTLKNLLSLLMLEESAPTSPNLAMNNLNQFGRLNYLLKSISYHLISCSYSFELDKYRSANMKSKFCSQLINKYRRMMLTLSNLNLNQLAKLHSSAEFSPFGIDNQQQRASKPLLDFFLDRLSVLDVQILTAITIMNEDIDIWPDGTINQVVKSILNRNTITISIENDNNKWNPKSSLYDLARLIIGETPMLLNLNLNENRDFKIKFQQAEQDDSKGWRELIAQDLLYPWTSYKLPHFITPINYDLFLHPNLTTKLLFGMVKIEFKIENPTRYIVINCDKLNLVELKLWLKQPTSEEVRERVNQTTSTALKEIAIRRVLTNAKLGQIYIELQDHIQPATKQTIDDNLSTYALNRASNVDFGELPPHDSSQKENFFMINISFNKTSLSSENSGTKEVGLEFVQYGDYFAQPDAEVKTLLYTQFEPTNARRVFPCFDEPQFKAKFQLNLVHEQQHQVLFNSPKRERVPYTSDGVMQMSVFETTAIPLSTYLVSFIVCDAQNIKSITSRVTQLQLGSKTSNKPLDSSSKHIQVQILAQFEHLSQAEYASQLVPQLLVFYQSHLQFPYPLDKLDLIAIPSDIYESKVQIDTMENMGLIWFKAPLLLVDPNMINQNLLEQISMIISHQLAHQYFGNIISISNWKDLWLYESLCQYLESIAISKVQAEWKLEEQFAMTIIQETLSLEQFEYVPLDEARLDLLAIEDSSLSLDSNSTVESLSSHLELSQNHDPAKVYETNRANAQINSMGLKRNSALLHMLLFNLLPSAEAQARLLRRCLNVYQYKTMSRKQFWDLFGEQLAQDGSLDRLSLDLSKFSASGTIDFEPTSPEEQHKILNNPPPLPKNATLERNNLTDSERVVFVRLPTISLENNDEDIVDTHRIKIRSSRLIDNLDLIADAWLNRQGFPLVTASAYRDRIHLRQERFSFSWWNGQTYPEKETVHGTWIGGHMDTITSNAKVKRRRSVSQDLDDIWPIPLMLVSRFNPKSARFLWMDRREMEVPYNDHLTIQELHDTPSTDSKRGYINSWFKLNVNQSSLIRVNYDERNWEALTEVLMKSHYSNHLLSFLDRANLIDDAFTLMRCGKLSVGVAMNLTLYLEVGEREYMPWTSALKHLDQMQTLLNQNPLWHRYVLRLIQPISSVIGWKDDGPHLMRKLRRSLFNVALQYGDEKTLNKAKQEFKSWYKSGRFIVPNLQELVYIAGIRYGDQQEWFHCWQKYQQLVSMDIASDNISRADDSILSSRARQQQSILQGAPNNMIAFSESNEVNSENEKRQLLSALASTHNTWLLEQFLNYSLDSTKIQPHHLKHVMQTLGKNPVARLYLWRFVRLNWATLLDRYMGVAESGWHGTNRKAQRMNTDYNQVLETMISESTKHFATKLDYEEVITFFDAKRKLQEMRSNQDLPKWTLSVELAIQQSLQVIRSNIYWRDSIEPKLTKWLSHFDTVIMN